MVGDTCGSVAEKVVIGLVKGTVFVAFQEVFANDEL
tara:strand:+ start:935 stop:1042 length:108 start_codon:yes stop_codon:yes gene_type:complete